MKRPRLPRLRPRPAAGLVFPDEGDDLAARGGYVFTASPDAPPMWLTEPVSLQADQLWVSAPQGLTPRQCYLLGGPGLPEFEVVEVDAGEPVPGGPCRVHRDMFRTLSSIHPAGTPVIAVTVRFVEEWGDEEP